MERLRPAMDESGKGHLHGNKETHGFRMNPRGSVLYADLEEVYTHRDHITGEAACRRAKAAHIVNAQGEKLVLEATIQGTTVVTRLGHLAITRRPARSREESMDC